MNTSLIRLLLLVAAFALCTCSTDGDVHVLTTSDFDDFVDNEDISLVEFYAPWCGHCKSLAPEYAKAATQLKEDGVKLAKVDATEESSLASRFGVTGYPTMKVFRKGTASEYKGPRDAAGIVSYMKKQAAPSITVLQTLADLERFVKDEAGVIFFGPTTHKLYDTFSKFAEKQRETFRFATTAAKELLEKFEVSDQIAVLQSLRYTLSPLEIAKTLYQDGDLHSFVSGNILPLVGEINQNNQNLYSSTGKPLVKFYAEGFDFKLNPKGANYLLNKVRKVAKEYKDKFSFAVASRKESSKEVDDLGLKGELPFAIFDTKKGTKFPAPSTFSAEVLKKHLDDYLAGSLESYVKSEPIPEQKEGEPVVVVGKNFEQIVNDPTKDVLLEAYAPWCGHCKSLEPKYKELAKKMSKYDSVTIAKIDATANDLPPNFNVRGFPTIFFIPADKKGSPIQYEGAREVKDFEKYIKKHASLPLKAKSADKEKDEL